MTTQNLLNNGLSGATGTGKFVGDHSPIIVTPEIAQINDTIHDAPVVSFTGVASGVNYLNIFDAAISSAPGIQATGSATDINLILQAKGTGGIFLDDGNGNAALRTASAVSSAVNYIQVSNSATGNSPSFAAIGGDANIPLALNGKGTGGVLSAGSTGGSSPASGYVGETIKQNIVFSSKVTLTSGSSTDIASIILSAGNWLIMGNVYVTAGTSISQMTCWINSASASFPDQSLYTEISGQTGATYSFNCPSQYVSTTGTPTYYLSTHISSVGATYGCGNIIAIRQP